MFFEDARKQAQALDDYVRDTKKLRGPLHGVPVSFKDICKRRTHIVLATSTYHIRPCRSQSTSRDRTLPWVIPDARASPRRRMQRCVPLDLPASSVPSVAEKSVGSSSGSSAGQAGSPL